MGDRQPHDKIISLWFSANSFRPYSLGAKSFPYILGAKNRFRLYHVVFDPYFSCLNVLQM